MITTDSPITVFLVEDEDLVRETLAVSLRNDGFRILENNDGKGVVTTAANEQPKVILLDIRLGPSTDGIAVLRELKANPATAMIPVCMLTNLTDQRLISESVSLGARGYLVKSELSYAEVAKKVREITGKEHKN